MQIYAFFSKTRALANFKRFKREARAPFRRINLNSVEARCAGKKLEKSGPRARVSGAKKRELPKDLREALVLATSRELSIINNANGGLILLTLHFP